MQGDQLPPLPRDFVPPFQEPPLGVDCHLLTITVIGNRVAYHFLWFCPERGWHRFTIRAMDPREDEDPPPHWPGRR